MEFNLVQILTIAEYSIYITLFSSSILALAVGIEKAIVFSQVTKFTKKIVPKMKEFLSSGDIDAIEEFEKNYPQNIYGKFCSFIKLHYSKGELVLLNLANGKINEERIFLEKRLIVLASLGSNAPFIGLLGTVFGIIKAFYALGVDAGSEMVMHAIAFALITTAIGLIIAIPSVMCNNYFNRRLKVMTQTMEQIIDNTLASYHIKKGEEQ